MPPGIEVHVQRSSSEPDTPPKQSYCNKLMQSTCDLVEGCERGGEEGVGEGGEPSK